MKSLKFVICGIIVALTVIIYGIPVKNSQVEEFAKKSIQSRTFQIHSVCGTRYKVLTNKYIVSLHNEINNEELKVEVWFPKDYKKNHMIKMQIIE